MERAPLSTPRHILTSIIKTLTSTPIPLQANEEESASNPLKTLPPSHRALLATLHVLIPPPTLLQALDLLDRKLVTRITPIFSKPRDMDHDELSLPGGLQVELLRNGGEEAGPDIVETLPTDKEEQPQSPEQHRIDTTKRGHYPPQTIYHVQSSVPPKSRFSSKASITSGTRIYTVHLEAWNCDCAAFTFAAFPASSDTSSFFSSEGLDTDYEAGESLASGDERGEWEFGGLSLDGRVESQQGVPCCKHLLACVLAERWKSVLGRFVNSREASLEEMAGLAVGE